MNANRNYVIGALLAATLALTACGSDVPSDADPKPYQGATSSASASATAEPNTSVTYAPVDPSATPKPTLTASPEEVKTTVEDAAKKPLNIDIDKAFAEYADPKVEETFPKADFDTREGVRFGLETLANVVGKSELYKPRQENTTDMDFLKGPDTTERFDGKFLEKVNADIAANGRTLIVMNADRQGTYGTRANGSVIDPVDSVPVSVWNTPAIQLRFDENLNANVIDIRGVRTMTLVSDDGKVDIMTLNYNVSVVPSGDAWAVSDMGVTDIKVTRGNG